MELFESLKACRQFLATADDIQSKSGPICYALTDAFVAKYGEDLPLFLKLQTLKDDMKLQEDDIF